MTTKKINLSLINEKTKNITADDYAKKFFKKIILADGNRSEIIAILNKIYSEGFEDGFNEGQAEIKEEEKEIKFNIVDLQNQLDYEKNALSEMLKKTADVPLNWSITKQRSFIKGMKHIINLLNC